MTTWTREDEQDLNALLDRKQTMRRTLEDCVELAVERWAYHNMSANDISSSLMHHATQIRKVLEPFDSEHPGYLGDILK